MDIYKKKVIYLPADCISIGNSRSYYLGRELAKYYTLFWFKWSDPRDKEWAGMKKSKISGIQIFIKNFFKKNRIKWGNEFHEIKGPFLMNSVISKIIGETWALRVMYYYNTRQLKKWVTKIKPDIIFFMDGNYYFSIPDNFCGITITDIQDDFDLKKNSPSVNRFIISRCSALFANITLRYAVSRSAAFSMKKYFNVNFEELLNGADFDSIRNISQSDVQIEKQRLNLENKFIISYIGGDVWFDHSFVMNLIRHLEEVMPEIHLITIGNLPIVEGKNVTNLGVMHPSKTYLYYRLSDVGVLLKNSKNDIFLYNSVPLKIIQYAAARKPVISFPIHWLIDNSFSNVTIVSTDKIQDWEAALRNAKTQKWDEGLDNIWGSYSWENIGNQIITDIDKCKLALESINE